MDDPNVDTDADRPITEKADDGDDDDAGGDVGIDGGVCRSQTLELRFQLEPNIELVSNETETGRAHS